jgi:hypothetical protein
MSKMKDLDIEIEEKYLLFAEAFRNLLPHYSNLYREQIRSSLLNWGLVNNKSRFVEDWLKERWSTT